MAAGFVAPVGDEVKAGEVTNADLGRVKEGLRFGSARRGRVCWVGCCMVRGKGKGLTQYDVLPAPAPLTSLSPTHLLFHPQMSRISSTGGTQSPPLEDCQPMGACSIKGGNVGGIPDRQQRSRKISSLFICSTC